MFWRENPLLRFMLVFLPGIALGLEAPTAAGHAWVAGLLILGLLSLMAWQGAGVSRSRRILFSSLVLAWFFAFGTWHASRYALRSAPRDMLSGACRGVALVEAWGPPALWRRVQARLIYSLDQSDAFRPHRLVFYIHEAPRIRIGDTLFFQASLQAPEAPKNPKEFDYAGWLAGKGIHRQAFLREGDYRLRPDEKPPSGLDRLREACLLRLEKALPDREAYGVGAALILGYRVELDPDLRDAFRDAGAMHVLAVSGMHVGLVFLMLGFFLSPIERLGRPGRVVARLLGLAGIWSFIAVAGMPASARRAGIMFSFLSLGKLGRRKARPLNMLALAAGLLLFLDPRDLHDLGFQLSFLALAGIICFQPALASLWQPSHPMLKYPWQLTCVSVAAQLATGPVCLYYFHQWPVYFWITGLFAVPAASFILLTGLLALAFGGLPWVGEWLGDLLLLLIRGLNALTRIVSGLPGATWKGVWVEEWALAVSLAVLVCVAVLCITRRWRWLVPALFCLWLALLWRTLDGAVIRRQRLIAVYDVDKGRLIDLFEGRSCLTLADRHLDSMQAERAAGNFRLSRQVEAAQKIPVKGTTERSSTILAGGLLQFHGCIIGLGTLPEIGSLDVLLVGSDTPHDLVRLRANPPRRVVLDSSLSFRQARQWRKTCRELGLPLHDIYQDGALVFYPDLSPFKWK